MGDIDNELDKEFNFEAKMELFNIPHHQLPNYASALNSFGNSEQDWIRQAYNTGNFTSLRHLPNNVRYGEVFMSRQNKILENQLTHERKWCKRGDKKVVGANMTGLFHTFEYIPSRYSLAEEEKTKDRLISEAKRLQIGSKDFIPASDSKKLKYEDAFENDESSYPYSSDPYELAKDQVLRERWIEESKVLHGPFFPVQRKADFTKPSVKLRNEVIRGLYYTIINDWEGVELDVIDERETGLIVVRFNASTLESTTGLSAYMNILVSNNMDVCKWGLRKVITTWNVMTKDGYIYFALHPPWTSNPGRLDL